MSEREVAVRRSRGRGAFSGIALIAASAFALSAIAACAASPPPERNGIFVKNIPGTEEENEPPPPCAGTPVELADVPADALRGVQPFGSKAELDAAVGATVYVVAPQDHGPAVKDGKRHYFQFGEPLVFCRTKPLRNPGQVVSVEVLNTNSVLVKERHGALYSLPIEMLSRTPPRFSMDSPATAEATIAGAFEEALAARETLARRQTFTTNAGRDAPEFWESKTVRALDATLRTSRALVGQIVNARPRAGKKPACTTGCLENGGFWYEASPSLAQWMAGGIPDGGQRDAYQTFASCLEKEKSCGEARAFLASPPAKTGAAVVGGKLVVHVNPAKDAGGAKVEIDGTAANLHGNEAEASFDKDGSHIVTVTAKGKRESRASALVKEGKTVEVNVVLLPGR